MDLLRAHGGGPHAPASATKLFAAVPCVGIPLDPPHIHSLFMLHRHQSDRDRSGRKPDWFAAGWHWLARLHDLASQCRCAANDSAFNRTADPSCSLTSTIISILPSISTP